MLLINLQNTYIDHDKETHLNIPLKTILQINSILIAREIADTPKKNPEGEYLSDALTPAVTYTAQSSYAQSNPTASRRRTATAPAEHIT